MIIPLRDFVAVIKPSEESKTSSGLYLAPSSEEKMLKAKVVAVGSGIVASNGSRVELDVNVGDFVVFNKTLAVEVKDKDVVYLLMREDNIVCIVKEEK